jgi:hypothetical protein
MSESSQSGGIGFAGLLTILFIGLKLTGYIAWSWVWVLSPLWIGVAIFIGVILLPVLIVGAIALVGALVGAYSGSKR